MAEVRVAGGSSAIPSPYSWQVIADDVSWAPIRFELVCTEPVTIRIWISRGNSQNSFTRTVTLPAGLTVEDIPPAVRNKVRITDDDVIGDYRIEVGA